MKPHIKRCIDTLVLLAPETIKTFVSLDVIMHVRHFALYGNIHTDTYTKKVSSYNIGESVCVSMYVSQYVCKSVSI